MLGAAAPSSSWGTACGASSPLAAAAAAVAAVVAAVAADAAVAVALGAAGTLGAGAALGAAAALPVADQELLLLSAGLLLQPLFLRVSCCCRCL